MAPWRTLLLSPGATILEALKKISDGSVQIALVVDEIERLIGTVTDGDIRRGILEGYSLTGSCQQSDEFKSNKID